MSARILLPLVNHRHHHHFRLPPVCSLSLSPLSLSPPLSFTLFCPKPASLCLLPPSFPPTIHSFHLYSLLLLFLPSRRIVVPWLVFLWIPPWLSPCCFPCAHTRTENCCRLKELESLRIEKRRWSKITRANSSRCLSLSLSLSLPHCSQFFYTATRAARQSIQTWEAFNHCYYLKEPLFRPERGGHKTCPMKGLRVRVKCTILHPLLGSQTVKTAWLGKTSRLHRIRGKRWRGHSVVEGLTLWCQMKVTLGRGLSDVSQAPEGRGESRYIPGPLAFLMNGFGCFELKLCSLCDYALCFIVHYTPRFSNLLMNSLIAEQMLKELETITLRLN